MKKFIRGFLPNLALALVLGLMTIVIVDGFNPMMQFLGSNVTKIYIMLTCIVCLVVAISAIARWRHRGKKSH